MSRQKGFSSIAIIIVIVAVVIGALGVVFWTNFVSPRLASEASARKIAAFCNDGGNVTASDGIFCSGEIGIKLTVADVYKNGFTVGESYPVVGSDIRNQNKETIGQTLYVYEAYGQTDTESASLKITQLPMHSGYIFNNYYDAGEDKYYSVSAPEQEYDVSTGDFTETGEWRKDAAIEPAFHVEGVPMYWFGYGDAGHMTNGYLFRLNDKLVMVEHNSYVEPGPNGKAVMTKGLDDAFLASMKNIKLLSL